MPDPMWRQIAEDLRQKIESSQLGSDGRALPSELELREEYDASRNTVRDAIKWLVTRGLIVTRPGQGTFVVKKIDPFVTALRTEIEGAAETTSYASQVTPGGRTPDVTKPRVEIQQARELIASELQLAAGGSVVSRHRDRIIDGSPWSLQTTFYPMNLVERGANRLLQAEDIPGGAVRYIEQELSIREAGWRDRITVRTPDRYESDFFKLPDDGRIAVFEIIRTGYDESGTPFRVTTMSYPADRNQFVITVGKIPAKTGPLLSEASDH
jgi:GntR family transcriptional regulator